MTYTFKLARRLAVSRHCIVLPALVLLAACMGDTTAPDGGGATSATAPTALQISPRTITIETNQLVQFRGQTRSWRGDLITIPLAWQTTGGTIKTDGTFSSGATGTFKVTARGRGWKQVDSSTVVVVTPTANIAKVSVSPGSATVDAGARHTFTATAYLADGAPVTAGFVWSATGGDVDPSGVYTAGNLGGTYRVIATNTAGTLADTAAVVVNPPATVEPAPTLANVIVSPVGVSLALGGSKQFQAYGRNSVGDSVAVGVTFSATGGSITSGGLYTAGQTTGTYRVIATSSGLSDTAVVTLARTSASGTTGGLGIPFGPASLWQTGSMETVGTGAFTGSIAGTSASAIVGLLGAARTAHQRLVLNMTGGSHDLYLTDGVFDMAKWKAKMDTYRTAAIQSAVASAVADGTILGNSVMDEPHVHGLGDGNTWGPVGTMTKARVDSMCGYVKAMFPTLPVGVVHQHNVFEPTKSYAVCEFIVDAYSSRLGDVTTFRDGGLALTTRDGMGIIFSMNILNGGIQAARDGLWNCPLTTTGGRGTYEPNCRMTAAQVRDYGRALGPAGCAMLMWKYDSDFMANANNQQSFKDVAGLLATLPRKPCGRQ
jgi:hypothetical protein